MRSAAALAAGTFQATGTFEVPAFRGCSKRGTKLAASPRLSRGRCCARLRGEPRHGHESDVGRLSDDPFATHGLVDNDHPELSGIVLSLYDKQGKAQDGFLRPHDIYNLKLPVDLVVLSACSTALGKEIVDEGLVGLVRGFMYAGSLRVLTSLWKVDDEATGELMTRSTGRCRKGAHPLGGAAGGSDGVAEDEALGASLLLGGVRAAGRVEVT